MANAIRLVQALKGLLKTRGITYRALASELSLSESAVKQMFAAGGNMSLNRLERICEILTIDISDLVSLADADAKQLQALTLEQEAELIADAKLLLVTYCLVNHWSFEAIIENYDISDVEGIRFLAKLDRMKLIELLPGNRVKLLISSNFEWQRNGPIEKFFRQEVQGQFFNSSFSDDGSLRLVKNGDISKTSRQQISERLISIGQQFDDIVWAERKLPAEEKQGSSMVLAIRHWEFSAFSRYKRGDINVDARPDE